MQTIYTIGHSVNSWHSFLDLIKPYKIDVLADVRSMPYSKIAEEFNRENLIQLLKHESIKYVYIGDQLGGRTNNQEYITNGKVDYDLLSETIDFKNGIDRLLVGSKKHKIVLMCSEKEPLHCHRTILISRHLVNSGLSVNHILENGEIELHTATIDRLLNDNNLKEDMFRTKDETIEEMYKKQGEKIAYKISN